MQLRIEDVNESEATEMSFFFFSFCFCFAEFSRRNPVLFARFIPNLLPATHCDQLPNLIQEDRMLQEELVTTQGFTR